MIKFLGIALMFAVTGCASTKPAMARLHNGMPNDEVRRIMGEPADRSMRGVDEAWQYYEVAGFGQCKYTTLWIRNGTLVGVSTRRGKSVAGCGLGAKEVNWNEMP